MRRLHLMFCRILICFWVFFFLHFWCFFNIFWRDSWDWCTHNFSSKNKKNEYRLKGVIYKYTFVLHFKKIDTLLYYYTYPHVALSCIIIFLLFIFFFFLFIFFFSDVLVLLGYSTFVHLTMVMWINFRMYVSIRRVYIIYI